MEHRGIGPFTVAPICQNPPHAVVNMAAVRKLRLHGPAQAWRQIPAFRDEGPILHQGRWELTFSQGPRLGKVRAAVGRPEVRRVGKECVSTSRSRWSPSL